MGDLLAEATMAPFDPMLDYAGCVIQYGYVVYFSVSWCARRQGYNIRAMTAGPLKRQGCCSVRAVASGR